MEIEISCGCSTSLTLELSTEKFIHTVQGFEFCTNVVTNVETEKKKVVMKCQLSFIKIRIH